jgi:lipid A 3-O-deacylase
MAVAPSAAPAVEIRGGAAVTGMELFIVLPQPGTLSIDNLEAAQGEVYFELPDTRAFRWMGSPRLELGGVVSLSGRESSIHGGLNWHLDFPKLPVFFEIGLGVGAHNGAETGAIAPRRNLGCPFGVHYSYGLGVWLGESVTLTAKFQHLSHAYLCQGPNEGLNSAGVNLGFVF